MPVMLRAIGTPGIASPRSVLISQLRAVRAPTARSILAQRNALGQDWFNSRALKGRGQSSRPFRAGLLLAYPTRRVAPGYYPSLCEGRLRFQRRRQIRTLPSGETPFISFQTVAELWRWAERNNWGAQRRSRLESFIQRFGVIGYEQRLARFWARVITDAERVGRPLDSGDAWIIASAVAYQLPLYTHDRDFLNLPIAGLEVVSFLK